jgi:uncharacterized protein YdeI (YjbR/CyaY-like superfamily)
MKLAHAPRHKPNLRMGGPLPTNAVHLTTRAAWRRWLNANHRRPQGVWLVSNKTVTGKPRIPYEDAVEEALCFGWIDSTGKTLDEERSMQWFSPRRPRTGWSKINKARVERLLQNGLMHPAGLARLEQAKADGSWRLFDGVEALRVPPDLKRALLARPPAARNFAGFPPSARKMILAWIVLARRPDTRATRIERTAALAQKNLRVNQWRAK